MDRRQKSTLRSLHIRIADELILDEDFYAALRRDKIFTNGMLDIIKSEAKPRDRVYKMLELLEKRGPKAFEGFVWILKENYEWLAEELEEQYNIRLQRSLQEKENKIHMFNQYETESKEIYDRSNLINNHDQLPKHQTVSTLVPKYITSQHTGTQVQESVYNKESVYFVDSDTSEQHYYHNKQQKYAQTQYDSTDNTNNTGLQTRGTDVLPERKHCKDACVSPIGIIETSRRNKDIVSERTTQNELDACPQGFDEIESQTDMATNSDVESQITSTTEVQSEDFDADNTEIGDDIDAAKETFTDDNDDNLLSSEVYYDQVRSESSQMSNFDDEAFNHDLRIHDDDDETVESQFSFDQSEALQLHNEKMMELFMKLNALEGEDTDGADYDTVTWDMINSKSDELINRLKNSDDMKMIKKCYELFEEKEKRQPLNICIERSITEKKDCENHLREKTREMDQMVFDLWKHQQDMSNMKKLRKNLTERETENKDLKASLENLERDAQVKLKQIKDKDERIQELESKLQELQCDTPRKQGNSPRRNPVGQRRVLNTLVSSSRRPPGYDSRMSSIHSSYTQPTPRNVTTAMRKAPGNRK